MGILNGQVVEAEFFLDFAQQRLVGFEQANPDESVFVFELFAITTFATRTPWA